ncbi:hypothetical protein DCCM_1013 [Desulfocucumis palustris]|uniref:Uncharacterized protein n=1 Tax=Desulfocucumis palustris TaxID=1898651 RepID=A0A2L2X995_9FIRM|nr:hypothetical protein [Desulfocucumis palustris]GBF32817.1 hypothetical protein DCCM_1013 [Desulfocucumis palustris]
MESKDWHALMRFAGDNKGSATLEILLALSILVFLTYGVIEYGVLQSKHQYAEHTMHKYKDRMRVEGYLTTADEAQLINEFNSFGCIVTDIQGPRESRGDSRVLRTMDLAASTITLRVTCQPVPEPLLINRLIGSNTPGAAFRIIVGGGGLSERINP